MFSRRDRYTERIQETAILYNNLVTVQDLKNSSSCIDAIEISVLLLYILVRGRTNFCPKVHSESSIGNSTQKVWKRERDGSIEVGPVI